MTKVYSIDGITPVVHPGAYVHPSAVLIGDVFVGPGVHVGPLASLPGDFGRIVVDSAIVAALTDNSHCVRGPCHGVRKHRC